MPGIENSEMIPTPVWETPLSFHEGGVYKFYGPMECSKTRAMIATILYLVQYRGYLNNRVFANCWLDLPGSHWLTNDELKKVLRRAFNTEVGQGRWDRCIFAIMEADDLYSHITQADRECYYDLRKASQSMKRNIHLLYEVHEGRGVPKYMRDKTEISIRPVAYLREDRLDLYVCNGQYSRMLVIPVTDISLVNNRYRRFDVLV